MPFLDYAYDQVERAVQSKRKGSLTAYRDTTLFKVMYGWGCGEPRPSKLDLMDWGGTRLRRSSAVRHVERPLRQDPRGRD